MEETKIKNKPVNPVMILNLVMLAGIIILYVLFFTSGNHNSENSNEQVQNMPVNAGSGTIVFVNSDFILQHYELVDTLAKQMDYERIIRDKDFSARQKQYEEEAGYFQESVEKQRIDQESAQKIYEQLMLKQQELHELQDQYSGELAQKEFDMNIILLDSVRNYLKRFNQNYQFDYILSYNATGNILAAKDTLDITSSVLEGLNKEYRQKFYSEK
jgi:outer membrane protein